MKNTTSSSTTSISETTLISGSSWRRGLRFIAKRAARSRHVHGRRRGAFARACRLERVRHADGVLFHFHDDAVDAPAQVTIGNECRDRHAQARRGRDQRLGDAARERARIAHAACLDGVECADDAGHRAEQPEERRDPRDRAERVEKPLQLVHHVPAGILEALHQHLARTVAVREPGREQPPEGRVLLERRDHLVIDLVGLDELPDLLRQLARQHPLVLQGPQPLQDDGGRGDRAQNDRPHERAARPHYFPHPRRFLTPAASAKGASYRRDAGAQGTVSRAYRTSHPGPFWYIPALHAARAAEKDRPANALPAGSLVPTALPRAHLRPPDLVPAPARRDLR